MLTGMVSTCRQAGEYLSYRDSSAALSGLDLNRDTPAGACAGLKCSTGPPTAVHDVDVAVDVAVNVDVGVELGLEPANFCRTSHSSVPCSGR